MGWALTNTVSSGHRYRFVVQQPSTPVQGAWSGDVQGALQVDWGFEYDGNAVTLQQIGSSNLWVGEAIPHAVQLQTVKEGFTYIAMAVQARDDLTRLVHKGQIYSFDVRVPATWTVGQATSYLQGNGWSVSSIVPTTDATSFLAGKPTRIATTVAFAVTGVWNGTDKMLIADSDGTISYGVFSNQAAVSIAGPAAPVSGGSGSVIALALGVSVAGLVAWWLVMKAPRIFAARQAERNSPPRGTVRIARESYVFMKCACGRKYTEAQWKHLHFVGYQKFEWGEVAELRNCVCDSTLALFIVEGAPKEAT